MDLDTSIKRIKEAFSIAHGKDSEVMLRYVGTSGGITKPWILTIESYTTKGEMWETAAIQMLDLLRKDLEGKVRMAQSQMKNYQDSLNRLKLD